ncbi:hypothetical protein PVK06_017217 [Gossypium arboreum]|uniref:Uncharacterized protein n=1 Tax=Gossypium arboreum TaxID=29729 RepID=A0ABR0Q2X4_GOSAR|nr:hypothetical protein PVK06_017217 [Gossypium arboreum]
MDVLTSLEWKTKSASQKDLEESSILDAKWMISPTLDPKIKKATKGKKVMMKNIKRGRTRWNKTLKRRRMTMRQHSNRNNLPTKGQSSVALLGMQIRQAEILPKLTHREKGKL